MLIETSRWNASVILATRTLAFPIGVGCTVVFKASELSPRTHHALLEMFEEAGLPKGVLNVVQARREDGAAVTEALISHPSIRKIEFIGSRAVGIAIGQTAAKYLKPVLMELGGKSAAIVLDDANLKQAAALCIKGGEFSTINHYNVEANVRTAFLHHGQICFSTERIIVQEKVASQFQELLKQEAVEASGGNGVTLQMVKNSNDKLLEAQEKGAKFLVGGPSFDGKTPSLKPTILTGVTQAMKIFDEESFGPSVSLYVVKNDQEAIDLVNVSEYGLNAAVHSTNMERAINVARALEVRQCHINNITEHDEREYPDSLMLAAKINR
jgi:acyl-CoA reductase-like NAD-dependent aldehyde dehydrogenase